MELDRIEKILQVKEKLIHVEIEELKEEYIDINNFKIFIDSVCALLEEDERFFIFLYPLKEDVLEIISLHRFSHSLDKELIDKINFIISTFNKINIPDEEEKYDKIFAYYNEQEDLRGVKFKNFDVLMESINNDIDVFRALLNNSLDKENNTILTLASLNYFGNVFEEIFKEDKIKNQVLNYLDKTKKKYFFKKNVKEYIKCMEDYLKEI